MDLDAREASAGAAHWPNRGELGDFVRIGAPSVVLKGGIRAVSFNQDCRSGDAYQSLDEAPASVVGPDPTRTIEVWVWNEVRSPDQIRRNGPARPVP